MYFDGLMQELGDAPRYLLTQFGEVPVDAYVKSDRAFLGRHNWVCPEGRMLSVALPAHKDATRLSHWINSQHWNFLKHMVPRRFALARAEGASVNHFNEQYLDHVGEKIHIPLSGRTTVSHTEIGSAELKLFKAYRLNDRFPATLSAIGDVPAIHLVFMFAPASVAYFSHTSHIPIFLERTAEELVLPAKISHVPV